MQEIVFDIIFGQFNSNNKYSIDESINKPTVLVPKNK